MNQIEEAILRNAVTQLEQALAEIKAGGFKAEILVPLSINWALTDIKTVLSTQPVEG
jgi:hypothetical protein